MKECCIPRILQSGNRLTELVDCSEGKDDSKGSAANAETGTDRTSIDPDAGASGASVGPEGRVLSYRGFS